LVYQGTILYYLWAKQRFFQLKAPSFFYDIFGENRLRILTLAQADSKIHISFLKKEVARGGERTRVPWISFIFSFFHHFTTEPQRLPIFRLFA
jgi:hypothetical protein